MFLRHFLLGTMKKKCGSGLNEETRPWLSGHFLWPSSLLVNRGKKFKSYVIAFMQTESILSYKQNTWPKCNCYGMLKISSTYCSSVPSPCLHTQMVSRVSQQSQPCLSPVSFASHWKSQSRINHAEFFAWCKQTFNEMLFVVLRMNYVPSYVILIWAETAFQLPFPTANLLWLHLKVGKKHTLERCAFPPPHSSHYAGKDPCGRQHNELFLKCPNIK